MPENTLIFKSYRKSVIFFILTIIIYSCGIRGSQEETDQNLYSAAIHFSQDEIDSLMVDMVTYIGRKPPMATSITRFDLEFRNYYINYSKEFKLLYYYVADDGQHYYFLTRPARSTHGNRRGVGGFFRIEDNKITGFQELFNTPVFQEDELTDIGIELFSYLVDNGHTDLYMDNDLYIEWPDERLKYDKDLFEWRYINQ